MRWCSLVLAASLVLVGCRSGPALAGAEDGRPVLKIRWQRLVDEDGRTCSRCRGTREELGRAAESLRCALAPLGIEIRLEEGALGAEECADDILESNRIWIDDIALEDWLDAEVGESPCESCCEQLGQTVDCRTTAVAGRSYEVIPARLIIKAGLLAAAELIEDSGGDSCCPDPVPSCCGDGGP